MTLSEQARITVALRKRAEVDYDQPWADALDALADIIQYAPQVTENELVRFINERTAHEREQNKP